MAFSVSEVVLLTPARAKLSELADQAKDGAGKIITENSESYGPLIDAERAGYRHRLKREHIHALRDEIDKGLATVEAGRTRDAREAIIDLKHISRHSSVDVGSC